jgi:restriction system protein
MSLFMVRAGRHGEREDIAIKECVVTIGWEEIGDLSKIQDREALKHLFEETYPDMKSAALANQVGQVWTFLRKITKGDLAVLPLKTQHSIAIGEVTGDYKYRPELGIDAKHTRAVKWIRTDIPRPSFDQDLLYSFGAFMTVCKVDRHNAEERVKAVLKGAVGGPSTITTADEAEGSLNIEEAAEDQILKLIQRKFVGHGLARLVDEVLQAQGYITDASKPGPDGGVDILAGAGPMGFAGPRICVQVKSSPQAADVKELRNLQGVAKNFGADQALLVCWGGFKSSVLDEAKRSYFTIRLWDSGKLIEELFKSYDKCSDSFKAELPLKKVWALVEESEE